MTSKSKSIRLFLMWTALLTNSCVPIWAQDGGVARRTAPDNTRTNERDRSQSEATADQQKENPSDQAITQQITRAILQDKTLSTYAHNVKIVTRDGNVILKGPVRSIGEKRIVETKAVAIAGEDRVSSQLQIVPE
jgi:hyperosmotically inducible periplasmic protein